MKVLAKECVNITRNCRKDTIYIILETQGDNHDLNANCFGNTAESGVISGSKKNTKRLEKCHFTIEHLENPNFSLKKILSS